MKALLRLTAAVWVEEIAFSGVSVNAIVLKTSANGVPESIASGLAQATRGHYASIGIAGAKLGDDAARRP